MSAPLLRWAAARQLKIRKSAEYVGHSSPQATSSVYAYGHKRHGHPQGTRGRRPCLVEERKALGTSHSFPDLTGGIHDALELQVGLLIVPSALFYPPSPYCLGKHQLYKTSKVHYRLYFSIFQMTLKTSGAIQFKTTRERLLVRVSGNIKKVKILAASGFESVFLLNGTSIFLTWKGLQYIIQRISNFK